MKKVLMVSLISISAMFQSVANATANDTLTCTFTKLQFGAKPELNKSFEFVTRPGYLPNARGKFQIPGENVVVSVSSTLIDENVQTSMTVKINGTNISTSFTNTKNTQLAYLQINNSGVIRCSAD